MKGKEAENLQHTKRRCRYYVVLAPKIPQDGDLRTKPFQGYPKPPALPGVLTVFEEGQRSTAAVCCPGCKNRKRPFYPSAKTAGAAAGAASSAGVGAGANADCWAR